MFIIRNKATKEIIRKSLTPLRTDGKLPSDLDPSIEVLVEVEEAKPTFNAATEKLVPLDREEPGAPDDPISLIHGWQVVALSAEELATKAEQAADNTERDRLKTVIADLRQGNGTAGERLIRVEKALAYLLKRLLIGILFIPMLATAGHRRVRHFNPRDAGAVLALDSRFITGLADGDAVASWADRTANGYNLAQSNASYKPAYRDGANGINGQPVVRFTPDDYLVETTIATAQPLTEIVTAKFTGSGAIQFITDTNNAAAELTLYAVADNTIHAFAGTDMTLSGISAPLSLSVLSFEANGGSSVAYHNGVQKVSGAAGSNGLSGFTLGRTAATDLYYLNGDITQVVVLPQLNIPLRRRLEQSAAFSFKIAY